MCVIEFKKKHNNPAEVSLLSPSIDTQYGKWIIEIEAVDLDFSRTIDFINLERDLIYSVKV